MGVGPEMLDAVVVDNSAGVDIGEILLGNDIAGDTLEKDKLGPVGDLLGRVEGKVLDGLQPALLRLRGGGDNVSNGAIAGKRTGEAAATLDVNVVAVRRLVVEGGGVANSLLALESVVLLDRDRGSLRVVIGNDLVALAGEVDGRVLAVQKGTERNVPRPQSGVALDKAAGEVRDEEDVSDGKHAEEDTENDTAGLASAHLLERLAVWQLVNDEESKDAGGKSKIEGDKAKTPLERILPLVDTELDGQEKDGGEGGGDERSDDP